VCRGHEPITGTQAGTQNAELLVPLILKPVDAAANVDNSLTTGRKRATDVGADRVVGALKLGRAADVVVGHGEPQGGDSHLVEDGAE
jgi:hypothetical protein